VRRYTMHRVLAPSNSIPGPDAAVPQRKETEKESLKFMPAAHGDLRGLFFFLFRRGGKGERSVKATLRK
jgi:hypothetical protein